MGSVMLTPACVARSASTPIQNQTMTAAALTLTGAGATGPATSR